MRAKRLRRWVDADLHGSVTHGLKNLCNYVPGMINLDFNARGRLVGIEVVGATQALPPRILDGAGRI